MIRLHHELIDDLDIVTIASDRPWKQNCHVIVDRSSGESMIIDPGTDDPDLIDAIRQTNGRPRFLLVTHGHPDHIGGAALVGDEFGLDCLVSAEDERIVRHAPLYAAAFGQARIRVPTRLRFTDGADLRLGAKSVGIAAVPGHTPGSLAFSIGRLVFTGDTLLREHVGRSDFPLSSPDKLVRSIDGLFESMPEGARLFPGHGRPWSGDEARSWWAAAGRTSAAATATAS
jgi:glyoxylase-like metal-dependent hydrolase (beta-lactamase superfamily II)